MGNVFWEQMAGANLAAIVTMGEEVEIGGVKVDGVVDAQDYREGAAPGGRITLISAKILIMADIPLADGMEAKVRGLPCKVDGWETIGPGAGRNVMIGPFNRWSGDIPGL
jgi:hypothetical protein